MPKIFEYLSYIIRFYSNDHLPIHVHVQIAERESKAKFLFFEKVIKFYLKKLQAKNRYRWRKQVKLQHFEKICW